MQIDTIETAEALPAFAEFSADPAALEAAAAFLAKRVIERRNTIPILSHVRLEAHPGGTVTLTGTDLHNWANVTIAADVTSPGAVCVDAGPLADALAKLRKGKATEARFADLGEGRANLAAGRSGWKLRTLPADDFPLPPTDGEGAPLSRFTVPAARFLADLAALAPCQSTEETRYYLNGIAMQARDLAGRDRFVMAATDGHNIAVASRELPAGAEALPDIIASRKSVALVCHAAKLASDAEAVAIEFDPAGRGAGVIRFDLGPVSIMAKAIDGTYPDWARCFEGGLAPTDGEPVMFPELLPGAPLQSMDKLAKAAKARIDWAPAAQGYLGTVPGDDGLLFGCLAVMNGACQHKGYSYHLTGQGEAQAYLLSLAESRGLTLPAEFEAKAAAIVEAFGDDAGTWDWNGGTPYRARPFGQVNYDGPHLITSGERVLGLTVAGTVSTVAWTEKVTDWEALIERETYHPARCEAIEGSYSIVMPSEGPGKLASASAITGPDGIEYPVADNGSKIHLSADQVRALIGESCFATMEITLPDGKPAYILQWLWDQGDSRFLTVRKDGRTFSGGAYVTRAEIEAGPVLEAPEAAMPEGPAPEPAEICPQEPQESEGGACPVAGCQSEPEALEGPEIAPEADWVCDPCAYDTPEALPAPDPLAELVARVAALEARIAAPLPAETGPQAVNGEKIEVAPTGGKARRTAAHERAIRRAWAERARRREAMACAERMASEAKAYRYERDTLEGALQRVQLKRRRAVQLARQRGRDMAAIAAMMHEQQARLEAAQRAPVYVDQEGREGPDHVGRAAHHASLAMQRAERAEARHSEASAAVERQQDAIERLGDELVKENLRAIRAETALAALRARANGWPPAVQSVKVNIAA